MPNVGLILEIVLGILDMGWGGVGVGVMWEGWWGLMLSSDWLVGVFGG